MISPASLCGTCRKEHSVVEVSVCIGPRTSATDELPLRRTHIRDMLQQMCHA